MSRIKCKKEDNPVQKLINSLRFGFAVQRKKDQFLKAANDYLRRKYGFHN